MAIIRGNDIFYSTERALLRHFSTDHTPYFMEAQDNTPDNDTAPGQGPAKPMTPEEMEAYSAAMQTDENMEKLARKLSENNRPDEDLPDLSFSRFLEKKEKSGNQ